MMRAICLVLLLATPASAQNWQAAVKKRLNEQWNNAEDKAYYNKQFGPSIKVLEIGQPVDLANCEIDSVARSCRDTRHDEVWSMMLADAKAAGVLPTRSDMMSVKDWAATEWTPVGIRGRAVRVKYEHVRGTANRRLWGQANPTKDRTFLLDRRGVIFAEFDSEHLRLRGESGQASASEPK